MRAWSAAAALFLIACAQQQEAPPGLDGSFDAGARADCNGRPDEGCSCTSDSEPQSCFLADRSVGDAQVMCTEGTRSCRDGVWSACENTHEYIVAPRADTQRIIDPNAQAPNCSICDLKCFKAIDNLLVDGGTNDGSVRFADGGGLTLLPFDASAADGGGDGGAGFSGCIGLTLCCASLSGPLNGACTTNLAAADDAVCDRDRAVYCPAPSVTGPVTGCTPGSGADSDCDGIPNVVDESAGYPFPGTTNQTIFHQIPTGSTAQNTLDVGFKVDNADIYILFDSTGTMEVARSNLASLLTAGDLVACAQLAQCCGSNSSCQAIVASNDTSSCYSAQNTYCGGLLECADTDADGAPNEELRTQGVAGAIRCLVGSAKFGLGQFREIPAHKEPEPNPCLAEGCRYGDRDEQLFRHLLDMTEDTARLRDALNRVQMNFNWDEPEGGFLALYSVVTGKGQYFGMNRPAVPDRSMSQGCPPNSFGYACFRSDAIPIVVMFTDAPHHNGPNASASDPGNCGGRGAGCPYSDLTVSNIWASSDNDSSSDRVARFVPLQAENASTAYDLGDVRGRYFSMVGDTTYMKADYPVSATGCGGADDAPDALIRFDLSAGGPTDINFHLTKNDAYPSWSYGEWNPSYGAHVVGTDDPTPATEFGASVAVFNGSPDDLGGSGKLEKCDSDAQPATLHNSSWPGHALDFKVNLKAGRYYVAVKGMRSSDKGSFQLQVGEVASAVRSVYRAPQWSETRSALQTAGVRVIPVVATGGTSGPFVTTAEEQAKLLATASGAVRSDGTPIWYQIPRDGKATGQAIVTGIAELARYLSMDVSLSAISGPDSATAFQMAITPRNSVGCLQPHPLLDASNLCTGSGPGYSCDTQYACRPGAIPRFRVSFTNPSGTPVPPNPSNPYGGYMFKLQLKGQNKYLLSEIPVFLIPGGVMLPPPPNLYDTTGQYEQKIAAADCKRQVTDAGTSVDFDSSLLPSWDDLYFNADMPEGTSMDFEMCSAESDSDLAACTWSGGSSMRTKVTVNAHGSCSTDADCANDPDYGRGYCATGGLCRFINLPKVYWSIPCGDDSVCPNGPLGAGAYLIHSYCETRTTARGFGRCVGTTQPVDIGSTLLQGENGKFYTKVRITMHADSSLRSAPKLYDWYTTYACHSSL